MSSERPWLTTYEVLNKQWDAVPEVPQKTISDYVRDFSQSCGDRTALAYLGHDMSYQQLDEYSDRMAVALQDQGCNAGDVLAIQLPNTPAYVIALIAAARIGMLVTSISPLLTAQEAITQCNDANVKVLLSLDALFGAMGKALEKSVPTLEQVIVTTMTSFLPNSEPSNIIDTIANNNADDDADNNNRVTLSEVETMLADSQATPISQSVSIDSVLYLQYTGGTTGKAKGAQLTSRNLFVNNIQANVFYGYRIGEETVASAFPFFHIGGTAVLFNALRTGSTFLVIPDPRNIESYCSEMRNHPPTVLANVPTLFQMLMQSDSFRTLDFSRLRIAISGAAPFAVEEIRRLESIIGQGRYCEVYGMTETSPVQTLNPADQFKPGFVGIPVPGTDLRIVDTETGQTSLPIGVPGEIIVSGPQVMQGYLDAPEANAKSLRKKDGKTWMYTGDIGFLDQDGFLKICDRSKDMLIVGGYKVFSVEVENKLQALPFIAMSAVVGRPDEKRPGNDVVQLYAQTRPDCDLPEEELTQKVTEFCREYMAAYKVPKEIFFVNDIPLTSVGKVDKKALRSISKEMVAEKEMAL